MSSSHKLSVFLCHASQDKRIVRELFNQLNDEGWMDVWLDEEKLLPGHDFDLVIEKAVENAHAVIVLMSKKSVNKEGYLQAEMQMILRMAMQKPEATIYLIPVRIDDCPVPFRLRPWQYVDYFPKSYRVNAYQRILRSLKDRATRLGIPTDKNIVKDSKTAPAPKKQGRGFWSEMSGDIIRAPGTTFPIIKALVGFQEEIEDQIERFPFEKNVFLMMSFGRENRALSDFIIKNLSEAGLNGVRADHPDWNLTNDVYNPIAVLYCCKYGIALFDKAETNQVYTPNVIYELGMMHNLGRECLILRNDSLPVVPFDLIKDLYMPYRGEVAVRTNIQLWLQRIMPGIARLADAAVSAQEGDEDSVVMSPDHISATEFTWRVLSKDTKSRKVLWKVSLTNKRRRAVNVKVQVLFLDKNGFALDDHMGPPMRALPPDETRRYEATATLSPDLANRIQRAVATVSTIR